jgi:phosphate transport system substrate-binding protein
MKPTCIYILLTILLSCSSKRHDPFTDTPTSGEINIIADESFEPMVQAQIDTFLDMYKYAKIHVTYLPESALFKTLMENDSVRIAIVARALTEEEKEYFTSRKMIPRSLKVAEDAVALIVNKENPDTLITYAQLGEVISGKISKWNDLSRKGAKEFNDSINIVFDRNGSANTRFLKENFLKNDPLPSNAYAVNSNAEVVNYVSENRNALGVISVNWISDRDDPSANGFLKKINVIELTDTTGEITEFYKPYQAYIALKQYPLRREILIINREGRNGLGTGFASFVAGDKGQRLIRLMGLLPATMPVRIINSK